MRRKVGLFFMCGVVLPLVFAPTASAQFEVTPKEPRPGERVTVKSFGGFSTGSPVIIRLSTREGRVLVATDPDVRGSINAEFNMPADVPPGWHLLVATQVVETSGRQRSFTPLRARIRVQSASASAAAPGGRGGLPGSPLGLVAVGSALLLLATGATLTARRLRTLHRPQLGS